MSKEKLTPRQVMYRLEKYEDNEKKLEDYKDSIRLEMQRLRKVESRYKAHIHEHSKGKARDAINHKNESLIKHHRHNHVFTIPSDISKDYVICYNKYNDNLVEVVSNLNVRCALFKIDKLSNDDVINNKLIIIDDNSDLCTEFISFNKNNISKIINFDNIDTLKQLNEFRETIDNIIQ